MARRAWSGAISFGMVTIPVCAYTSTDEKSVKFNQLHRDCGGRTKSPTTCPQCDREIERSEIVKGYEIRKGEYVTIDDGDLESLPVPTLKVAEIVKFIEPDEIDRVALNKTYYIGPTEVGGKAFALLRTALAETGLVALAKWSYSGKERLAVISIHRHVLALQTLFWADEVKDDREIEAPPVAITEAETEMAVTLVNAMKADSAGLEEYRDEYRGALLNRIAEKDAGREPTVATAPAKAPATDLMAALKASIAAAKKAA